MYQICGESIHTQALNSKNVTVAAYGATSSGKTYTVFGSQRTPGLVPRVLANLFHHLQAREGCILHCSALEIYGEKVIDLLAGKEEENKRFVRVRELISRAEDIDGLIERVMHHRRSSPTVFNDQSSRSHCILSIHIDMGAEKSSVLNFVDLAGR